MQTPSSVVNGAVFRPRTIRLECTADWIVLPSISYTLGNASTLCIEGVRVRAGKLAQDAIHTAEILAVDVSALQIGPLVRIPVTVVRPLAAPAYSASNPPVLAVKSVQIPPTAVLRHYVRIPDDAASAVLELRLAKDNSDADTPDITVHALQLITDEAHNAHEVFRTVTLTRSYSGARVCITNLAAGATLEVCLALRDPRHHNAAAPVAPRVDYRLCLHGLGPVHRHLIVEDRLTHLDVHARRGNATLYAQCTLKYLCRRLTPTSTTYTVYSRPLLSSRYDHLNDVGLRARQHRLRLVYTFCVPSAGVRVRIELPDLQKRMYTSSQLLTMTWALYGPGQLECLGASHPLDAGEALSGGGSLLSTKLPSAGEHRLVVALHGDDGRRLEKLRHTAVVVMSVL